MSDMELAEAVWVAGLRERLADPAVMQAVTAAVWSAPRNGTSWDVAQVRAHAALDALAAALAPPARPAAVVAGGEVGE